MDKKTKKQGKRKKRFKRYVKCGFCQHTGKQRWFDKKEEKYFIKEYSKRGYSQTIKNRAIALFCEGVGHRAIGRLLDISHTCAYYWVREYCESLAKSDLSEFNGEVIELDEMWHFCQKKRKKSGFGQPLQENPDK